jgi:ATP/ADP translocase
MSQAKSQNILYQLTHLDRTELLKLIVGGILFFTIIASYSLIQELKYGIFSLIVGPTYIPIAKLITFSILFPAILLDGCLVDHFKRYQLVILYTFIFGVIGLVFSYFFAHPEIGVGNVEQCNHRLFGWLFFLYAEAYTPFLLGVFWAFMNSIHNPKNAKKTYGFIVSISKLGGVIAALSAYLFLTKYRFISTNIDSTSKLQLIILTSSLLLLFASLFLTTMVKRMNKDVFKGYHTTIKESVKKTGALAGIKILFKSRYVLGVFLIAFFADIIAEILNYKRILIVVKSQTVDMEMSQMIAKMYLQIFFMHLLGLCISLFFTNSIMRFLGMRVCLFIMPIFTVIFAVLYILTGIDSIIIWLYIIIKSMYYTIGTPIRESLYIITSKDIQFKAKFVVDALGTKLARNAGQGLNYTTNVIGKYYGSFFSALSMNALFLLVPAVWMIVAYFTGKTYAKNLKEDKVIS